MHFTETQSERIRLFFRVSVFFKGITSLFEVIAGILVLVVPVSWVTDIVMRLAQQELLEDPRDFIATHALTLVQYFAIANVTYIAFYLLSRGIIKLLLVIALLKNQLWAYPASLVVLGCFMVYQMYRITLGLSPLLIALTAFDIVVMWFILREYQVLRSYKES